MNLTQMLQQWTDTLPKPTPTKRKSPDRSYYTLCRNDTFKRYSSVMGDEWVSTREVERRMGLAKFAGYTALQKMVDAGKMERRYRLENSKRSGVLWRVVKCR